MKLVAVSCDKPEVSFVLEAETQSEEALMDLLNSGEAMFDASTDTNYDMRTLTFTIVTV